MLDNENFTQQEIDLLYGFILKIREYYLNTIINDITDFIKCSNEIEDLVAYQMILCKIMIIIYISHIMMN